MCKDAEYETIVLGCGPCVRHDAGPAVLGLLRQLGEQLQEGGVGLGRVVQQGQPQLQSVLEEVNMTVLKIDQIKCW